MPYYLLLRLIIVVLVLRLDEPALPTDTFAVSISILLVSVSGVYSSNNYVSMPTLISVTMPMLMSVSTPFISVRASM